MHHYSIKYKIENKNKNLKIPLSEDNISTLKENPLNIIDLAINEVIKNEDIKHEKDLHTPFAKDITHLYQNFLDKNNISDILCDFDELEDKSFYLSEENNCKKIMDTITSIFKTNVA
ncbi:MAG: hypothetical protein D3925_12315 [Candidatus Electrothrix sp. AR5]|nr:hypothetical protein [Candidatus Electrothrix sp. AR5]